MVFYPILPIYFRIAGVPSYKLLVVMCTVLYILGYRRKVLIRKADCRVIILLAGLWFLINAVHKSINGMINVILDYVLVFFLLFSYFDSREKIEDGLSVLLNTSMVMSALGFFEFLTNKSLFTLIDTGTATDSSPELQMRGVFSRSEASFGHAIPFAIYLSMNAIIALYFFYETGKKKYKYMFIVLSIAILTTISRAPIIVFVAGVAFLLGMIGMKKLLVNAAKGIIGTGILLLVLFFAFPEVYNSFSFIVNVVLGVFSENALNRIGVFQNANPFEYRLALFSIAGDLVRGKIVFGTGNAIEHFTWGNNPYSSNLHYSIDNAYLYWLVRYGVVGLITSIIPLVSAVWLSFKNRKNDKLFIAFFSVFVVVIMNYFSVASLSEARTWIILFVMCWALSRIVKVRAVDPKNTQLDTRLRASDNIIGSI